MASLDSIKQKMYRARHHFDELNVELKGFYESNPGSFVQTPTEEGKIRIRFEQSSPMPARFGLICGDCLQCMRSALDYLVWELVLAAGNSPGKNHMFPIALTDDGFQDDLKNRRRLDGIDPEAIKIIEVYQPFKMEIPTNHAFAVLEYLANINKHRRVLFTEVTGVFSQPSISFPHMYGIVGRRANDGTVLENIPVWAYARFQDGVVKDMEITAVLDVFAQVIVGEFMPLFERFF